MAEPQQQVATSDLSHPPSSPTAILAAAVHPTSHAKEDIERPSKRLRIEPPPPMTAAVALAEARQRSKSPAALAPNQETSPNPQVEAVSALMGVSQNAFSKAYTTANLSRNTAETTSATSPVKPQQSQPPQPLPQVASTTDSASTETIAQTSPASMSGVSHESVAVTSGPTTTVASPQPVDGAATSTSTPGPNSLSPDDNSRTFSYPAPLLQPQLGDARRGNSLPHSGLRTGARSPSSRKHKCPYCATEFTRHHNLKSHLLTHSQEKPYLCSTCQSRFRRLHDLKRHTKLHTGERPHVCPKCNRKFARGDALARHNKGPGGCAGRRASLGSFAGDEDFEGGDESMEGVMYGEPESMDDVEENAAKGTPSIRRQAPSGDDTMEDSEHYSRIPSTYPPIQGRPPGGIASGAFPPRPPVYGSAGSTTQGPAPSSGPPPPLYPSSGSTSNLRPSNPGSIFAQNPLTESPKPLSPGQPHRNSIPTDNRIQSPNVPHFPSQSQYPRTLSASGPSPTTAPQLPPPHVLHPPDSRYTLASQGAPTHPPTQPSGPPTHMSGSGPLSSHSNSLSSHGQSGHASGDNAHAILNKDDRIWAFVKSLEQKVDAMQDEIRDLKAQLAAATAGR